MSNDFVVRELQNDVEIAAALPVMQVLRSHLKQDEFVAQVRRMMTEGYRLAAGSIAGKIVVVAGYRFSETLFRGRHLFVDDLVTDADEQKKGYATQLLQHLAKLAQNEGVAKIYLDSRITAKSYYEKVGFTMHTSIPCWIEVEKLLT